MTVISAVKCARAEHSAPCCGASVALVGGGASGRRHHRFASRISLRRNCCLIQQGCRGDQWLHSRTSAGPPSLVCGSDALGVRCSAPDWLRSSDICRYIHTQRRRLRPLPRTAASEERDDAEDGRQTARSSPRIATRFISAILDGSFTRSFVSGCCRILQRCFRWVCMRRRGPGVPEVEVAQRRRVP